MTTLDYNISVETVGRSYIGGRANINRWNGINGMVMLLYIHIQST